MTPDFKDSYWKLGQIEGCWRDIDYHTSNEIHYGALKIVWSMESDKSPNKELEARARTVVDILNGETTKLVPKKKRTLAEWALQATPEEIDAANWKVVFDGLLKARTELDKTGVNHSWLYPYINIAADGAKTPKPKQQQKLTREQIREVFMSNGFTIKEGQSDLKEYVYKAAESLLQIASQAEQEQLSNGYVQLVPEKCDRIVWKGCYYNLPLNPVQPVEQTFDKSELENMAHAANQEALSYGVNFDVFMRFAQSVHDRVYQQLIQSLSLSKAAEKKEQITPTNE